MLWIMREWVGEKKHKKDQDKSVKMVYKQK